LNFDSVIGQSEAKERLKALAEGGSIPHALMFCGPKGSGKLPLAVTFAMQLLNTTTVEHPDLHFTFPVVRTSKFDGQHKMISDDFSAEWYDLLKDSLYFDMRQWLDAMGAENQQALIGRGESVSLIHKLSLKSSQGGYKISVIWLPEYMNSECANALLKLLEEPPSQTLFLMVCEDPDRLLDTIRSRVQRFDVKRIDDSDVEKALVSERGIGEADAHRIARIANGNWLTAVEQLSASGENSEFLNLFINLMRKAYMRDIKELTKWSDEVSSFGREKQKRLLTYFLRMVRENFMYNFHKEELCYMTQEEENFSQRFARFINEANVIGISELLQRAYRDISQNANGKIVFYHLALNIIVLLIQK